MSVTLTQAEAKQMKEMLLQVQNAAIDLAQQLAKEKERGDRLAEALAEISLMGMTAPMGFTEEETKAFQAKQAWRCIQIASIALRDGKLQKDGQDV